MQGMSFHEIDNLLNKKSGFVGLSGETDLRAVLLRREQGDERAAAAYEVRPCCCAAQPQSVPCLLKIARLGGRQGSLSRMSAKYLERRTGCSAWLEGAEGPGVP